MNFNQLFNTIVRAAIWRLMWRMPVWFLWAVVGAGFIYAALLHR